MKNTTFNLRVNNNGPESKVMTFEGDLSLKNANEIKNLLMRYDYEEKKITFHMTNVEKIDITTIQIIKAIKGFLHSQGKTTEVISDLKPESERLLINSGFPLTL